MNDYISCTCGVTGVADLTKEQACAAIPKLKEAAAQAIASGYKYFWLAVVGAASVHYAAGIAEAIRGHDGITLELMIPSPQWGKQFIAEHGKQMLADSNGFQFISEEPIDNPTMITNNRVLDLSSRMIVVSGHKDKEALSIIQIAEGIDVPVETIYL